VTDRSDVTRLRTSTAAVVSRARGDLNRFWGGLDLTKPDAARDALLGYVPALVSTYGEVASTVAADWYETARAKQVRSRKRFSVLTVAPETDAAAIGSVRYAAGHLYTGSPGLMLPVLSGAVQRHIAGVSRRTIGDNVRRDPARPHYARIPQGPKTCAFCEMLASRGFVYATEDLAGGDGSEFHDECDCQIVADWSDSPSIAGYDPGELYGVYAEARDQADGSDHRSIAAVMRRLHPDRYTDGVAAAA
jgi:hypothetical protein